MFFGEEDGGAFLAQLADEITSAEAILRDGAESAFSECGGAPEEPHPANIDSIIRERVGQLRAISVNAPVGGAIAVPPDGGFLGLQMRLDRPPSPITGTLTDRPFALSPPL